ncbi:MAG: group 1 truncated hemoglobin [Cocleimonas sp.]|nr:group 1 truncated hemoglobin [Cocleimonas sp.]
MSVYKKIGGKAAVEAVVNRFYEIMLADDRVKDFFSNVNMDKQKIHQRDFIVFALGGASEYAGQDMRAAHQHLVDHKGLSDVHFDATFENLVTALRDLNVPEDLIAEAGKIVEGTRKEVLCQ